MFHDTPRIPLDYRPRLKVYKKRKVWYWDYYLPNGKRIQRPAADDERTAKERGICKESLLIRGEFDEYDKFRMLEAHQERLTLAESYRLYFELTAARKTGKTLKAEQSIFNKVISWFEAEKQIVHLDEISPMMMEIYLSRLLEDGMKAVSVNNYLRLVKKVLNKFVALECLEVNRLGPVKPFPLSDSQKARQVILASEDIEKILSVDFDREKQPIRIYDLVLFILNTGMRIGEALHLEWSDINLEKRYVWLHCKPDCPTRDGLGWAPKWKKERVLRLNDTALQLLRNLPVHDTIGYIKGKAYPARFVFPKELVKVNRENCLLGAKKCLNCPCIEGCPSRKVIYSRCDCVTKSWKTLLAKAGVEKDYHIHDLRRTFNTFCIEIAGFTQNQASHFTGNTEEVNELHYTSVLEDEISRKIEALPFNKPDLVRKKVPPYLRVIK